MAKEFPSKILMPFLATIALVAFSACGDKNATDPLTENIFGSPLSLEVKTFGELPDCNDIREGMEAYVVENSATYVCVNEKWVKEKSSSSSRSSSSVTPQSSDGETSVSTGTMTDSRDGRTYKTVTIGTQTWMAENLNYAYTGVPYKVYSYTSDSTSWCYEDGESNCAKYGRFYTWAAAMDSVGTWSTNGKGCGYKKTCSPTYPVRGVCPEGWHLPTIEEFETLFTAVGGKSIAGQKLKSTTGWTAYRGLINEDAFAFSALPAGNKDDIGNYNFEGYSALFWSSTESNSDDAYSMYLFYSVGDACLDYDGKFTGFSVRCLKD